MAPFFKTGGVDRGFEYEQNLGKRQIAILIFTTKSIRSEQHIEFGGFRRSQEIAVLESRETSVLSGLALMTGKVISQTLGNTFVKKDLHPSWPTSAALASSSAVMASWRLTEGKSSRNSSRVSPALR